MMAPQNRFNTFSAAASVAPIVLWNSNNSEGNVYLAGKNTFLEFYTDEKKALKRNACARSASCDSSFKEIATPSGRSSTTAWSNSPSPSLRSFDSNDSISNRTPSNDSNSHETSKAKSKRRNASPPRSNNYNCTNGNSQYQGANQYYDASYNEYEDMNYQVAGTNDNYNLNNGGYHAAPTQACTVSGGYPVMMMPVKAMRPMPMMMPCVQQPEQEMQPPPKVVTPPKKQDLKELNTEPVDEVTTLMIRGIPCSFSQDTLMKLIDNVGLKGKYDFFYLPRAGKNGSNLGYAFINFTDEAGADHCMASFNGVPLDPCRSTKICTIAPGDIQGLDNLRKHFRRTAVSRGSRGPVFLKVHTEEEDQQ